MGEKIKNLDVRGGEIDLSPEIAITDIKKLLINYKSELDKKKKNDLAIKIKKIYDFVRNNPDYTDDVANITKEMQYAGYSDPKLEE